MPGLLSLDDLDLDSADRAGRKAATLGFLKRGGFPVPDGRILDAGWFEAWCRDDLNASSLEDRLAAALDALGPGPFAIRSSGLDEDGDGRSMAGCFRTTLHVDGAEAATQAVLDCFGSVRRARTELQVDAGGMAVLVQRQIAPEAAGVAFTADPVTGERDVVCIEAVQGLGDALMDGSVDAERWRVEDTPGLNGSSLEVLSPDQAARVAEVARRIADRLGVPSDIEWALVDGEVAVLQARPITALPAAPIPILDEDPPGFWQRDDHCPVPTPATWELWYSHYPKHLTAAFKEGGAPLERLEIVEIRGQAYSRVVTGGPDGPPPPGPILWLFSRLAPSFRRAEKTCAAYLSQRIYLSHLDAWDTRWKPELTARIEALLPVQLPAIGDRDLLDHLQAVRQLIEDGGEIHARLGAGHSVPYGLLLIAAEDWLGWTDAETSVLLGGYSTGTTQVDLELAELVAPWADDPRLHTGTLTDVRAAIPQLADALDRWCAWEGQRRLDYDLCDRTLAESPEHLLTRLRRGKETRERLVRVRDEALAKAEAKLAEARAALPADRFAEFERLLADARRGIDNRDNNALVSVSLPSSMARHALLELGRRAVERDVLLAADHALYLLADEWTLALSGTDPELANRVHTRRGRRSWALANPGPAILGEAPVEPDPTWFPKNLSTLFRIFGRFDDPKPTGEGLVGLAGGGGSTEGIARVLHTPDDVRRLQPGDVLVCQCTGAAWAHAYAVAGAVVTERGGIMSHPAILAREYGLPAALGIPGVTNAIVDGQRVRVDGSTGRVVVL